MIYFISDSEWANGYDARIELDGPHILLHSRGGATGGRPRRNVDYEKALETIVRRLRASGAAERPVIDRVLLDSLPARRQPVDERLIAQASELVGLSDGEVVALIRSRAKKMGQKQGAKGGNSTKALRIETQSRSHLSIRSTLKLMEWKGKPFINRLTSEEQGKVQFEHIHSAVRRLMSGHDTANFSDSRDYDVLLDDGTRLAPKKVFGLALEEALGIEAHHEHFSAGWGQPSFRIILAAGYDIVPKGEPKPTSEELAQAHDVLPEGATGSNEGTLKLVMHKRRERDRSLSSRKKAAFIASHGRLFCERCKMDPAEQYDESLAAACIEVHHAKVQVKDMLAGHITTLADLQCLCANCHRVSHREIAMFKRQRLFRKM